MVHGGLILIRYQRLRTALILILIRLPVLGMVHGGLILIRYQRLKDCPNPDPLASVNDFLHQQTGLRTALILIRLPV
jgi:hypothetical protein